MIGLLGCECLAWCRGLGDADVFVVVILLKCGSCAEYGYCYCETCAFDQRSERNPGVFLDFFLLIMTGRTLLLSKNFQIRNCVIHLTLRPHKMT